MTELVISCIDMTGMTDPGARPLIEEVRDLLRSVDVQADVRDGPKVGGGGVPDTVIFSTIYLIGYVVLRVSEGLLGAIGADLWKAMKKAVRAIRHAERKETADAEIVLGFDLGTNRHVRIYVPGDVTEVELETLETTVFPPLPSGDFFWAIRLLGAPRSGTWALELRQKDNMVSPVDTGEIPGR